MQGVIDKTGFNQLFIPYQSPLFSLLLSIMPAIHNLYIVPFDPLGTPLPTILTATQNYNKMFKQIQWGLSATPYPDLVMVYRWSVISNPGDDMFEDLYLDDMWVSCHVVVV
jgi:hypothetical protein